MKKIHIGYFYYDLMNLYGDSGNITILEHHLKKLGIPVSVDRLTVDEPKKISAYDMIYMGSGTERGLLLALMDLRKYKAELAEALEKGTHILATGNSFELFGNEIRMGKKHYNGLGLLDFSTEYGARQVHDLFFPYPGFLFDQGSVDRGHAAQTLVGFENHPGRTVESKERSLFDCDARKEGVIRNHFIGTYAIGPLLVRNPFLLEQYLCSLILQADPKSEITSLDLHLENAAYQNSIAEMSKLRLS